MNPTALIASIVTLTGFMFMGSLFASDAPANSTARNPILVELFTSEGCSSCPPADVMLQKMDQLQPVPGAELIVLSEHVDYWNHDGWKDPYSSPFYSDRQSQYASRFHLQSVYTPEMVVDGDAQFTGGDVKQAEIVLGQARTEPKIPIQLTGLSLADGLNLQAHLSVAALPGSFDSKKADVYLAVALDRAESQVKAGENAGRKLEHTAVVRKLTKIGTARQGQAFSQDVHMKLDQAARPDNLRVIVFLQEPGQGRVIGVTMQDLAAK